MRVGPTFLFYLMGATQRGVMVGRTKGEFFHRAEGEKCADAFLPEWVGACPRYVVVRAGGLERGKCPRRFVPDGETMRKLAGPCGWLVFDTHDLVPNPNPFPSPSVLDFLAG